MSDHTVPDSDTRRRLQEAIIRFPGVSVLVVGDLILDKYTIGKPVRISREAPVAVLEYQSDRAMPGGGTSPACTVASLGGHALLAGVVGQDESGRELIAELEQYGVDTSGIVRHSTRPTITKKRIVAQVTPSLLQQVARIDHIDRTPVSGQVEDALIAAIEARVPQCDAVLLSNYKSGTLTRRIVEHTRRAATEHGKVLAVDSQGDLVMFHGFGIVKVNQVEAEETLRRPLDSEESFREGLSELLKMLEAQAVIVTRSAEGMSVMRQGGDYSHIAVTNTSEVFDVTGAGDTVIAIATLAVASGTDLFDAARLANYGAGVVVRKWGNAVVSLDELSDAVR